MAHKTTKRTPITEGFAGKYIFLGLIFCLIATVVLIGLYIYRGLTTPAPCDEPTDEETTEVEPEEPALPDAINFQSVIDQFVSSTSGNRSVMVYDVERNEMAGEYNPTEYYNTASLYKLFVVYEGYRRVQNGAWDQNAKIGYTGNTLLECLDRAIRESYSPCAETLWAMIGHAELDAIIKTDYNILGSNISGLSSNAIDILEIMKRFYNHPDFDDETLITRMKDSFLNQPVTTYDWRRGLPSGFSRAKVYNKVGWDWNPSGYWNIYHDAAIVEFPEENRHFIVVVMTNRVSNLSIRQFGTNFENYYYSSLVSTEEL